MKDIVSQSLVDFWYDGLNDAYEHQLSPIIKYHYLSAIDECDDEFPALAPQLQIHFCV